MAISCCSISCCEHRFFTPRDHPSRKRCPCWTSRQQRPRQALRRDWDFDPARVLRARASSRWNQAALAWFHRRLQLSWSYAAALRRSYRRCCARNWPTDKTAIANSVASAHSMAANKQVGKERRTVGHGSMGANAKSDRLLRCTSRIRIHLLVVFAHLMPMRWSREGSYHLVLHLCSWLFAILFCTVT